MKRTRTLAAYFALLAALLAAGCARNQLRSMKDVDRQVAVIRENNIHACREGCYLFLGDSNMELINVQTYFRAPACNLAVRGNTTEAILKQKDKAAELQPAVIVILVGGNDLLRETPIPRIADNYRAIIGHFKPLCGRMYFLSNLPVVRSYEIKNPEFAPLTERLARLSEDLVRLNAELEKICAEGGVVYVDVYTHLLKDGELDPAYARDPVHIGPQGHDAVMRALKQAMGE